jgi:hypothetical protein
MLRFIVNVAMEMRGEMNALSCCIPDWCDPDYWRSLPLLFG